MVRHMRVPPSLVVVVATTLAVLVAPATAAARVNAYAEGSTSVGTASAGMVPTATPTYLVKSGDDTFFFFVKNDTTGYVAACSYWRIDGGPWYFAGTTVPYSVTGGGTDGSFPPDNRCEGHVLQAADETYAFAHQLTLSPGQTAEFCTRQWEFDGGSWSIGAPEACHSVRADGDEPTTTLAFSDATGRTGATNNPNGLRATLTYADSNPPRFNGSTYGDLRLCQVHDRDCLATGVTTDAYDQLPACTNATQTGATTWSYPTCTFDWSGADATVHECFALYEGAEADSPPSNYPSDPQAVAQTFTPSGAVAAACGSIIVDTMAPTGTATINRTNVYVGTKVAASIDAADERSGVASVQWTLDGGSVGTGTSVTRSIESGGEHTFTATVTDAAGNVHTSSVTLEAKAAPPKTTTNGGATTNGVHIDRGTGTVVRPVPRPHLDDHTGGGGVQGGSLPRGMMVVSVPRRIVRHKRPRYLPMTIRVRARSTIRITLRQQLRNGTQRVRARSGLRFVRGGVTGFRLRLPSWRRLAPGRYVLTVTQYRPHHKAATKRFVIRVVR